MKTEQKKEGQFSCNTGHRKKKIVVFFQYKCIYIYETCIYFKLTVKYEHIYIVLQGSKGKNASCNIPLNPIISDHCNKLSMTFPFGKKREKNKSA